MIYTFMKYPGEIIIINLKMKHRKVKQVLSGSGYQWEEKGAWKG
jgi:hypothetical protein